MVASTASNVKMNPTYFGYIGSTKDALLIIQAVLNNRLLAVPRRPHDIERPDLIKSGNVFVFIEEKSGIKRWTDGVAWSPSRILGRFLVYRELDRPALNTTRGGEKGKGGDKSKKQKRKSVDYVLPSGKQPAIPAALQKQSLSYDSTGIDPLQGPNIPLETGNSNTVPNRSLVGSLIASYAFKEYGLIKKTMSLTINKSDSNAIPGQPVLETIHLVSYYSAEDVLNVKLQRPVDSPALKDLQLSNELWSAVKDSSLGGKIPIEDEAYYFMDESNPNAIALGFNPAIHLQPQYQQHNQPQNNALQQAHYQQQNQQQDDVLQQTQAQHQDNSVANTSHQSQSQPQPATAAQQQNAIFNQGYPYNWFNPAFSLPQYQLQPQQPQQFLQSLPQSQQSTIQEGQQQQQQQQQQHHSSTTQIPLPPRGHHSINHPFQHSQSGAFSLPVPQSHDFNNASNFQDLSQMPMQYQSQLPSQQHQQPQPSSQIRYSPSQNFVTSQLQPPITYLQGNIHNSTSSTSSSGLPPNLRRPVSPNSPRSSSKPENNSPIVPASQSTFSTSYNLVTSRQQKNVDSPSYTSGNLNNPVGNPVTNVGTPAFYINLATGAPILSTTSGGNIGNGGTSSLAIPPQALGQVTSVSQQVGRFFYDENGQIGSFGFQPYANNSGTPN